jgi:agmatine/peptidylarginine deiminase
LQAAARQVTSFSIDDITGDIIQSSAMASVKDILAAMRENPNDVRYADAKKVCEHYFGEPRQKGSSHCIFKMPWPGDPRVNIQEGKGGKAKAYQVRQVLQAVDKWENEHGR